MDTKNVKKVLLVVGWIPVDLGTFSYAENMWWAGVDGATVPGFMFHSEGEVIQGPWSAIQAVKYT